jgi:D-sedoheptulose 7-phosphate isomerase
MVEFAKQFLDETIHIIRSLDPAGIEKAVQTLVDVRERGGRLFILGVGGSAGHASHAVNDFRKICGIESYAPTDNVSELTARTNDEGWETTFVAWLKVSRLAARDCIMVFSVGGGNLDRKVSPNLVRALEYAQETKASIVAIVGRDGGYAAKAATAAIIVPPLYPDRITPHTEGLCAVIWHLMVSHPALQIVATKWETEAMRP